MLQGELTDDETSEEDDLDEDEEWASDDDENTEEIGSTDETDEDPDETNEDSYTSDAVQLMQGTGIAEDASTEDDDDFSGDLPPEFENIMIFSGAETESDIAPPVLEENKDDVVSATKTAKSLDGSALKTGQEEEGPEEADATEKAMEAVDNVVKSLDEEVESKEMQKQQPHDYNSISLMNLKATHKKYIITAKV